MEAPVRGVRLRRFSFSHLLAHSWFGRVTENLRQLFTPAGLRPSSANGAPIHLLRFERSKRSSRAQTLSLLTHLAAIATILSIASQTVRRDAQPKPRVSVSIGPLLYSSETDRRTSAPSSGPNSGGGVRAASPANSGFFPPRSSVQLAPPRLPDNANHPLPITTAVFDAQAPAVVELQRDVGLPWMADQTNSGGSGDRGIGTGTEGGMGDGQGPGGGQGGSEQSYSRGVSLPTCFICPYPIYTDEARKTKIQGTVTLRVLVGADGRASDIRVVRGIGFGLDERAAQTVRGWKFKPARDASQHPVTAWITVEAVFRLF